MGLSIGVTTADATFRMGEGILRAEAVATTVARNPTRDMASPTRSESSVQCRAAVLYRYFRCVTYWREALL
eukprot:scaffold5651_cov108-Isochrysis_galbana.AAC.7